MSNKIIDTEFEQWKERLLKKESKNKTINPGFEKWKEELSEKDIEDILYDAFCRE